MIKIHFRGRKHSQSASEWIPISKEIRRGKHFCEYQHLISLNSSRRRNHTHRRSFKFHGSTQKYSTNNNKTEKSTLFSRHLIHSILHSLLPDGRVHRNIVTELLRVRNRVSRSFISYYATRAPSSLQIIFSALFKSAPASFWLEKNLFKDSDFGSSSFQLNAIRAF